MAGRIPRVLGNIAGLKTLLLRRNMLRGELGCMKGMPTGGVVYQVNMASVRSCFVGCSLRFLGLRTCLHRPPPPAAYESESMPTHQRGQVVSSRPFYGYNMQHVDSMRLRTQCCHRVMSPSYHGSLHFVKT